MLIPMPSLINICNISSVIIEIVCLGSFSLTMDAHAFNAPPPRRIIGHQCTNPHCGKVFTHVFAYDQHRNHTTRAGTLCASIMMREELTTVRRADRSSAVLSARQRQGNKKDARTKRDAHRRMSLSLCRHVYQRHPSEIQTNSAHMEAMP